MNILNLTWRYLLTFKGDLWGRGWFGVLDELEVNDWMRPCCNVFLGSDITIEPEGINPTHATRSNVNNNSGWHASLREGFNAWI